MDNETSMVGTACGKCPHLTKMQVDDLLNYNERMQTGLNPSSSYVAGWMQHHALGMMTDGKYNDVVKWVRNKLGLKPVELLDG